MELLTTADHPDLRRAAAPALRSGWPEFVLHDEVSNTHRAAVAARFPYLDVLLVADGEVLAHAVGVALRWDGDPATLPTGYRGAILDAVAGEDEPDTLCVLAATVRPDRTGSGLATAVLRGLRERAGLGRVVVPVRPPLKARYPLIPMADFARWTRPDGLHPDPWVRTHQRLGATVLGEAPASMVVTGGTAEWEGWTGMAFPQDGAYVVPGGLDPVRVVDGVGRYEEVDLWMRHA
ncbi:Long-chain-fatty-acid--CoA ligase [Saccharothrix longispora]|uniref:Long-chain-fatty-acid--CoA ligase n=1 Tax=Saccharothrix longispora TaxID=33920 RepID=UPI0028FD998D|nr:Long-chain-fatty-acid--CoA ligase [Saccharothrix longispora]MBY8847522.1 Long-chain-fatty-acid--CoA ligase [Saccharothrix sp. MB29]MDU0290571.1 Long-chain-fatty-acid--CoA ligase [Saccharothrix longispora]